jgi:peroxiredoxin
VAVPGGQAVTVPEALAGQFGVLLFYRGSWCPYCNAQLRAFQRAGSVLPEAGAGVAALSVNDEAVTAALIARHGLTFPAGYGAGESAIAALTGAFVNPDPVYLRPTGFVLDPERGISLTGREIRRRRQSAAVRSGRISFPFPERTVATVQRHAHGCATVGASPGARLSSVGRTGFAPD